MVRVLAFVCLVMCLRATAAYEDSFSTDSTSTDYAAQAAGGLTQHSSGSSLANEGAQSSTRAYAGSAYGAGDSSYGQPSQRETSRRGSRATASDLAADASPFSATTDSSSGGDTADSSDAERTYSAHPVLSTDDQAASGVMGALQGSRDIGGQRGSAPRFSQAQQATAQQLPIGYAQQGNGQSQPVSVQQVPEWALAGVSQGSSASSLRQPFAQQVDLPVAVQPVAEDANGNVYALQGGSDAGSLGGVSYTRPGSGGIASALAAQSKQAAAAQRAAAQEALSERVASSLLSSVAALGVQRASRERAGSVAGSRAFGNQVTAPSGAPASAAAPAPAVQGVPVTLVVEQTDSRFPGAQRVDVYEGAAAAEPSITDLAAFEGAFLESLIAAIAAPAPAPAATASVAADAEAAGASPAAAPAAAPVSGSLPAFHAPAAAPFPARPETIGTLPIDTFGADFSGVEPVGAHSGGHDMASLGHVGYHPRAAAHDRASLLVNPVQAAAGSGGVPEPLLTPVNLPTVRTAMHEVVAADAAARFAAMAPAAAAPASFPNPKAPGAAVGAAAAPAAGRAAMHEFVAADAALRAAAAAPEPLLASVKETRRAIVSTTPRAALPGAAAEPAAVPAIPAAPLPGGTAGKQRMLIAGYPAVSFQATLQDIAPDAWASTKDTYLSGVSQAASVDAKWVHVTGVSKTAPLVVDTQITYENSDTSASSALATSMRDTGGSTIYVPGFGNAAVTNVKELTVPAADPKLSLPGSPKPAPNPLQTTGTLSFAAIANSGLRPTETLTVQQPEGYFGQGGLTMGAGAGIAVGVIVFVGVLLAFAALWRRRTSRLHHWSNCQAPETPGTARMDDITPFAHAVAGKALPRVAAWPAPAMSQGELKGKATV
ncbi:hypothetical protein WJX81_004536 [Elliptochloris bilobata]|uniref:Uncharacterized protein n=1 Tax=Elliptochloris bilobata TaxID=381761 RepID=A0AAW1RZY3_9CHLO